MTTINYTTTQDARAALLCELAAARLRLDYPTMKRLTEELHERGYAQPMMAAEKVARAAMDAEREARG